MNYGTCSTSETDRDACDGSCGFACDECQAEAMADEEELAGLHVAQWETLLARGIDVEAFYARNDANERCSLLVADYLARNGNPNVYPTYDHPTRQEWEEAEQNRDLAEIEGRTPLTLLLLASIALKERQTVGV